MVVHECPYACAGQDKAPKPKSKPPQVPRASPHHEARVTWDFVLYSKATCDVLSILQVSWLQRLAAKSSDWTVRVLLQSNLILETWMNNCTSVSGTHGVPDRLGIRPPALNDCTVLQLLSDNCESLRSRGNAKVGRVKQFR